MRKLILAALIVLVTSSIAFANSITATVDRKGGLGNGKMLYRVKLRIQQGAGTAIVKKIWLSDYLTNKVYEGALLKTIEVSPDYTEGNKLFTVTVRNDLERTIAYFNNIKNDSVTVKNITETSRSYVYDLRTDISDLGNGGEAVAVYFTFEK